MTDQSPDGTIAVNILTSLDQIAPGDWDACACPEAADGGRPNDPFTTYRFLHALEASGSVGRGTGWEPRYLSAELDGEIIAVAPLYAKGHSQGEYIFDHNWAHAYESAGGDYYPKLQIAVPFTPVTGRRFLTRPGHEATGISALVQGAVQFAAQNELSSLHATFCTEAEAIAGERMGLLRRVTQQFHWENHGYADFDAFLASLSSRKRKNIRKERRTAHDFGGEIRMLSGDEIEAEHWDSFWHFYQDTGARKWGTPYLTREAFTLLGERMGEQILLIFAYLDGQPVAGAMNVIGGTTLFGRYWGCLVDIPFLHFELCYYQAIDAAIARGLSRVEAGAQGGHKLARGYAPVQTHSAHYIADPGLRAAVAEFLERERHGIAAEQNFLEARTPFRKG